MDASRALLRFINLGQPSVFIVGVNSRTRPSKSNDIVDAGSNVAITMTNFDLDRRACYLA